MAEQSVDISPQTNENKTKIKDNLKNQSPKVIKVVTLDGLNRMLLQLEIDRDTSSSAILALETSLRQLKNIYSEKSTDTTGKINYDALEETIEEMETRLKMYLNTTDSINNTTEKFAQFLKILNAMDDQVKLLERIVYPWRCEKVGCEKQAFKEISRQIGLVENRLDILKTILAETQQIKDDDNQEENNLNHKTETENKVETSGNDIKPENNGKIETVKESSKKNGNQNNDKVKPGTQKQNKKKNKDKKAVNNGSAPDKRT